jgi:hypothetical protein
MQTGGETLGSGKQGCIYYPMLNVDEHGAASESTDTTQVTKLFFSKGDFDIENFFLKRVNEITGGVGVVKYYGSDQIFSFSNPGEINGCTRAISILEPLPLSQGADGRQLLQGVPVEEIGPMLEKYLPVDSSKFPSGSPEMFEYLQLMRDIDTKLKEYNIPRDNAGRIERKHARKNFSAVYEKYKEYLSNGPPSIYCIHMKKISGSLTDAKLSLRNLKDAFEAFLKISHNNIIHCDLSFGNFFHDNNNVLLGDFGNAFDIISDNDFGYFRHHFTIERKTPGGSPLTEENYMKELVERTPIIGSLFSIEAEIALKLFFLWDIIDLFKGAIDKPEYEELTKKTKHIIKYIVSITKEQLIEFIKITLKHSNLKVFIIMISSQIDIPEERARYLVDQFTNFENYDSFYEVLSEVEGAPVAPPADIVPILEEKRNQIIKIIGPPSQGGRRKRAKKGKTGKRKYKKRVTRRMRR